MLIHTKDKFKENVKIIKTPKGDHNHWSKEVTYEDYSVEFNPYFGEELTVQSCTKQGVTFKECPDLCWGFDAIHKITVAKSHESFFSLQTFVLDSYDDTEVALDLGGNEFLFMEFEHCI